MIYYQPFLMNHTHQHENWLQTYSYTTSNFGFDFHVARAKFLGFEDVGPNRACFAYIRETTQQTRFSGSNFLAPPGKCSYISSREGHHSPRYQAGEYSVDREGMAIPREDH